MRTHQAEWALQTTGSLQFLDITADVQRIVADSRMQAGHAIVLCKDAGCSLVVNERESGLLSDIRRRVAELGGAERASRRALLGSASVVLPVVDGRLRLGTWQRLLLVELETAEDRAVTVQIVGE